MEPLILVPLETLALAREVLERIASVVVDVRRSVVSDAAAAANLALAAAEISYGNVRNNVSWGTEPERWRAQIDDAERHREAARRAFDAIEEHVRRQIP